MPRTNFTPLSRSFLRFRKQLSAFKRGHIKTVRMLAREAKHELNLKYKAQLTLMI